MILVHLTVPTQVCPRCTGFGTAAIGASGTCDSGASEGQSCTVDSLITVTQAEGDLNYALSRDCPPSPGQLAATLPLQLNLTTGTATLTGPTPCPGQTSDDACQGSPCNAGCTGNACVTMVPDPVTGNPVCRDAKGGISQLCCAGDTSIPCFPTAGGGSIVRTGIADPPKPVWPDPTYPKTSARSVLVATFCTTGGETATVMGDGLPGPGATILPVTETLLVAATP